MYGHVDNAENWANHLMTIRSSPILVVSLSSFHYLSLPKKHQYFSKERLKRTNLQRNNINACSWKDCIFKLINNIQASWVKMGHDAVVASLHAGVNDLGGTLMNESITKAAGASHG